MGSYFSKICCCKFWYSKKEKDEEEKNQKVEQIIDKKNEPKYYIQTNSDDKNSSGAFNKNSLEDIYKHKKKASLIDEEEKKREIEMVNFGETSFNQKNNIDETSKLLEQKKKELDEKEDKLNHDMQNLNKMKEEIKINKQNLEKRKQDLDKKETDLGKREEELDKKEENLEERKQDLNNQEQQLQKKKEEMNINIKTQEDTINQKNQEILEKEKTLKEKEDSLIEKESELNEKESELIESQNKFNQEKIIQEKKFQQKEESLKEYESSLKEQKYYLNQEKKDLENDIENFERSKLPIEIGLRNIGATCYMNATLQALSHTEQLTSFFLTKYNFNPNDQSKKMSNEMYKVILNLWDEKKKKGDYPPNDFKIVLSEENPLFAGVQANDSKDLINFLLERFHKELNMQKPSPSDDNQMVNQLDEMQTLSSFISDYFQNNKSIITDCFYGILETKSKCAGCQYTKYNFQIYSFLEFPLQEVNLYMYQLGRRFNYINQDGKNPDVDLYECFDYYQKVDVMNGQNQMYCNICNGNRDTFYGTVVYSLPNYLIINLNRGKGGVYECKVNFPETLNLLNYITFKEKTVLQLYAVISHYGPSSMSGHFIAYCKHRINKKWYKYNDSIVTECTKPQEYYEGMPYILFYKAL